MGLFSSEAERQRKQNLKDLEDKRLRFAQMFAEQKIVPENILFTQRDGGFAAVAVAGDEFLLITGPAPGAKEDFSLLRVKQARARTEPIRIKSEGLGGLLGFGKKGGLGFKLLIDHVEGEEPFELVVLSGLSTYLESEGTKAALFSPKRRRGNPNFVWEFRPVDRDLLEKIESRWLHLING